jgi:hypothetical protein
MPLSGSTVSRSTRSEVGTIRPFGFPREHTRSTHALRPATYDHRHDRHASSEAILAEEPSSAIPQLQPRYTQKLTHVQLQISDTNFAVRSVSLSRLASPHCPSNYTVVLDQAWSVRETHLSRLVDAPWSSCASFSICLVRNVIASGSSSHHKSRDALNVRTLDAGVIGRTGTGTALIAGGEPQNILG